jgi:uncharacterized protein (TIGR02246 family)
MGQFSSTAAGGGTAEDEVAIKELLANRDAAWNAHDAAAWSAFFAPDAHFTSWRGDRAQGRENIRIYHEPLFKGVFQQSKNTVLSAQITFYGADLAIVESVTELTGVFGQDGKPLPDRKYYPLVVLQKHNGKWEIIIFHNVRDQTQ